MKKDIEEHKAIGIAMAIVPYDDFAWDVYLLNLKTEIITNIIVNCKGFGNRNNEPVETSKMRYMIDNIEANTAKKIEPIPIDLFDLSHQYWVSFFDKNGLFDKKYIFADNTLCEANFTTIPILDTQGILIK